VHYSGGAVRSCALRRATRVTLAASIALLRSGPVVNGRRPTARWPAGFRGARLRHRHARAAWKGAARRTRRSPPAEAARHAPEEKKQPPGKRPRNARAAKQKNR
jgi:hypothetical protein